MQPIPSWSIDGLTIRRCDWARPAARVWGRGGSARSRGLAPTIRSHDRLTDAGACGRRVCESPASRATKPRFTVGKGSATIAAAARRRRVRLTVPAVGSMIRPSPDADGRSVTSSEPLPANAARARDALRPPIPGRAKRSQWADRDHSRGARKGITTHHALAIRDHDPHRPSLGHATPAPSLSVRAPVLDQRLCDLPRHRPADGPVHLPDLRVRAPVELTDVRRDLVEAGRTRDDPTPSPADRASSGP
jgi:hypothetical protein